MVDKKDKSKKQPAKIKMVRGVTVAEYHRVYRRIVAGEMTWEQAEKRGHLAQGKRPGPKRLPLPQVKRTRGKS